MRKLVPAQAHPDVKYPPPPLRKKHQVPRTQRGSGNRRPPLILLCRRPRQQNPRHAPVHLARKPRTVHPPPVHPPVPIGRAHPPVRFLPPCARRYAAPHRRPGRNRRRPRPRRRRPRQRGRTHLRAATLAPRQHQHPKNPCQNREVPQPQDHHDIASPHRRFQPAAYTIRPATARRRSVPRPARILA